MTTLKENNESMAIIWQRLAKESYANYEIALNEGGLKKAAFWQRQQARDFKIAYRYLCSAIFEKDR